MLGFTPQEQRIVLFLIFSLLVGSFVKIYQIYIKPNELVQVDPGLIDALKERAEIINEAPVTTLEEETTPTENDNTAILQASRSIRNRPVQTESRKRIPELQSDNIANPVLVNLNLAGSEELQTIPKIGPVLAQRIIDYREESGPFSRIEEIKQVKGVGEKTFQKIKPYLSLN